MKAPVIGATGAVGKDLVQQLSEDSSSVGANAKSKVFYTKMKGALDDAVQELGFEGCSQDILKA